MTHSLGTWEVFTINIDAPPDSNEREKERKLIELTEKFEDALRAVIKKYNGKEGLTISMTDSIGHEE